MSGTYHRHQPTRTWRKTPLDLQDETGPLTVAGRWSAPLGSRGRMSGYPRQSRRRRCDAARAGDRWQPRGAHQASEKDFVSA
jgi:hypothetical protein